MKNLRQQAQNYETAAEEGADIARAWQHDPERFERVLYGLHKKELGRMRASVAIAIKEIDEVDEPFTDEEEAFRNTLKAVHDLIWKAEEYVGKREDKFYQNIEDAGQRFEKGLEGLASTLHNRGFIKEANMVRGLL